MQRPERRYQIVLLGSGGVGKSCLTAQFVHNVWIESYDPTIEDTFYKRMQINGRNVVLEILDTAGTDQFVGMRELYIRSGQGFLLVFSITSASSFRELALLREEIIRIKDDPSVPIFLVGNKADLEENRAVSRSQAFALSQSWGKAPYYESSARRRDNVDQIFVNLCKHIIRKDSEVSRALEPEYPNSPRRRRRRHRYQHPTRYHRDDHRHNSFCTIL